MSILKNKKTNGFSLVEVLVAISLNLLVVTMIMAIVIPGLKHVRMIRNQRDLHSATQLLITQFNYWIKQAADITASSPTTLEIQLPDNSIKTITQNGDIITIDGDSLMAHNVIVDDLEFTEMNHSVKIEFDLRINGSDDAFSATTTVAQRNSF